MVGRHELKKRRAERRDKTFNKIESRKRDLFNRHGSKKYYSHIEDEEIERWDQETYNKLKNQYPFSGECRKNREEYNARKRKIEESLDEMDL